LIPTRWDWTSPACAGGLVAVFAADSLRIDSNRSRIRLRANVKGIGGSRFGVSGKKSLKEAGQPRNPTVLVN